MTLPLRPVAGAGIWAFLVCVRCAYQGWFPLWSSLPHGGRPCPACGAVMGTYA